MTLYIIDNENKKLEVTDLNAAIKQATMFVGYGDKIPMAAAYWNDVLIKLLNLKQ